MGDVVQVSWNFFFFITGLYFTKANEERKIFCFDLTLLFFGNEKFVFFLLCKRKTASRKHVVFVYIPCILLPFLLGGRNKQRKHWVYTSSLSQLVFLSCFKQELASQFVSFAFEKGRFTGTG